MTLSEARVLLELAEDHAEPETVRSAYLRRVRDARLEIDPDGFTRLREAYELLIKGASSAPNEVASAREELAVHPDSVEARWKLLSYFPYSASPEALPILCHGAERQRNEFLDELLFHFPEKVPGPILHVARDGAAFGRLLLIADVHAIQGRPGEALEALRAALAAGDLHSPAMRKLAIRPVLSLQTHAQIDVAREALALVKQRAGQLALNAPNIDWETATVFRVADELERLDASFPVDLRQVAARAAKGGDFANARYEAHFATRLLKPREVRKLSQQLQRDAPTLANVFGLTLTDEQLRPAGTPVVRIPIGWATFIVMTILFGSYQLHHSIQKRRQTDDLLKSVNEDLLRGISKDIDQACMDPDSERCRYYRALLSNEGQADAGTTTNRAGSDPFPELTGDPVGADGGVKLEDLGIIGKPQRPPALRRHRSDVR
jgi:hypothetical protein